MRSYHEAHKPEHSVKQDKQAPETYSKTLYPDQHAGEFGEKETLLPCWWDCKLIQPLWRTIWRFLKKLKYNYHVTPAIPLVGMYPDKTIIQKDICTSVFIAALFTVARTWK